MDNIERIVAEFQPEHLGIWIKIAEKMVAGNGKISRSDSDVKLLEPLEQDNDFKRMQAAKFLDIEENQTCVRQLRVAIAPVSPRQKTELMNSFVVLKGIEANKFLELLKNGVGIYEIATAGD